MANTRKTTAAKTAESTEPKKNFSFEHDGETYEFEHDFSKVRKPGFLRKHRHDTLDELTFTVMEEVAGDEALEVLDEMDRDEWNAVVDNMWEAIREGEG